MFVFENKKIIAILCFAIVFAVQLIINPKIYAASNSYTLGHWLLDEQSSGSCTGGGDSCDSSGNGNNGTWINSPSPTLSGALQISSFSSGALDFNDPNYSNDSYVSVSNVDASDLGGNDFTISFWMNPISWGNGNSAGVIDMKTDDNHNGLTIYSDNGQGMHIDARLGQQNNFVSNSNVTLNQWNNWTLERIGNNLYWYLNGTLDASGTTNITLSDTEPLEIGHSNTWNGYFQGGIEDVRIYTVALNTSALSDIANGENINVIQPSTSPRTVDVPVNGSSQVNVLNDVSNFADPTSLTILTQPSHGTAVDPSGIVTYTPDQGYIGDDSLTYQICSDLSSEVCNTGTLNFDVEAAIISSNNTLTTTKSDPETGYGQPSNYSAIYVLFSISVMSVIAGILMALSNKTHRVYKLSTR